MQQSPLCLRCSRASARRSRPQSVPTLWHGLQRTPSTTSSCSIGSQLASSSSTERRKNRAAATCTAQQTSSSRGAGMMPRPAAVGLAAGAAASAPLPSPWQLQHLKRARVPRLTMHAALTAAQDCGMHTQQRSQLCLHRLARRYEAFRLMPFTRQLQQQQQRMSHTSSSSSSSSHERSTHVCRASSTDRRRHGSGSWDDNGEGGGSSSSGGSGFRGEPDAFGRYPQQQPSSWEQLPDPWTVTGQSAASSTTPPPPPPGVNGANGTGGTGRTIPDYEMTDWGWDGPDQNWDPAEGLSQEQIASMQADYDAFVARQRAGPDPPRDKWITPLLDWQSITGAFDPDQRRTEDAMADEALTNKGESREAIAFAGRLVVIPLITGALVGRALAEPVLGFTLANNPDAFGMTGRQKIEGAARVHQEEARVKMLMAIGQAPPLTDVEMLQHLREFAVELQEEERRHNENALITLVCDSISAMVLAIILVRDTEGRNALFSTIGRLFEGLSDIAKAVLIILVADTMLGYHSEEGWTGLIDVVLGHYGIEVEEKDIVLFVGVIPIAIDVLFKYWIFIGLNRISPGAVVTIKQLDRH